jgi:hypothetical protein
MDFTCQFQLSTLVVDSRQLQILSLLDAATTSITSRDGSPPKLTPK